MSAGVLSTPLKYTTPSAIARQLRSRLDLIPQDSPYFQSLGAKEVDYSLYEQIGEQVEARVDMGLGMLYVLPIPINATQAKAIIASIVEKFVVAEILAVHYQQSQNAESGGDLGYGSVLLKQAKEECYAIGLEWGNTTTARNPLSPNREYMVLPGVPVKEEIPDVITRNYSVFVPRPPMGDIEDLEF